MMKRHVRSIAWAGLTPHEGTLVRLVLSDLADQLNHPWRIEDSDNADILLVDPAAQAGRLAHQSRSDHEHVIEVIERTDSGAQQRIKRDGRHLVRPLAPRMIVDMLNSQTAQDEDRSTQAQSSARPPGDRFERPLAEALRAAFRNGDRGTVMLVEDLPAGRLLVDVARDCLIGPVRAVDAEALYSRRPLGVRELERHTAYAGIDTGEQAPLRAHLLQTLVEGGSRQAIFGNKRRTPVRMPRCPSFSSIGMSRDLFRPAALIQQVPYTACEIADYTDVEVDRVVALLNTAWIVGYLEVEMDRDPHSRENGTARASQSATLMSRIRKRLRIA